MELLGKHVVVTGASKGIGREIALELAKQGAVVTGVARSESELNELAQITKGYSLVANLFDSNDINTLIPRAHELGGPIDVFINNAGLEHSQTLFKATEQDIAETIALNLLAPMQLTRLAIQYMATKSGGRIVNISSMAANGGFPGFSAYSASKAGLSAFSRVAAQDLKHSSIKITRVEVGPVPTELLTNLSYEPAVKSFARMAKLGLLPNVSAQKVAKSVCGAIKSETDVLYLPKRAAIFGILSSTPQAFISKILKNIG